MRVGSSVISVTVSAARGATKPSTAMNFETQEFVNETDLAKEIIVQAKLGEDTTFAWSMQDDHANKHMVFFNTDKIQTTRTSAVSLKKQGKGAPTATREAFVLREMAAWGVYDNITHRLLAQL